MAENKKNQCELGRKKRRGRCKEDFTDWCQDTVNQDDGW